MGLAQLLVYLSLGVWFAAFLEAFCWARNRERQASRMRRKYLKAILRQDEGFFNSTQGATGTSQVVTSVSNDTQHVLAGKCKTQEILSSQEHESYTSFDFTLTKEQLIEVQKWVGSHECAMSKEKVHTRRKTSSSIYITPMLKHKRSLFARGRKNANSNTTTFCNLKVRDPQ